MGVERLILKGFGERRGEEGEGGEGRRKVKVDTQKIGPSSPSFSQPTFSFL